MHFCPRVGLIAVAVVLLAGCGAGQGTTPAGSSPAEPASPAAASSSPAAASSLSPPVRSAPVDLQALLDGERTSYGAPGALAVLRVGDQRWSAVSGTADVAGTPITDTTRFRIASITKPIVATLVLRAIDAGKVSLDDVVGELLPGMLRPSPPVTVRMLLNHTSGIFDESNDGNPIADMAKLSDPKLLADAQALAKRYAAGDPVRISGQLIVALSETHDRYFAPGTDYHYSNTNYELASMILEKVTERSLADLLASEIVEPLGLRRTSIAPPDLAFPEFRGYGTSRTDNSLVDVTDDLTFFGSGGEGGIISTADELLTMMQAIVAGRLLPEELAADQKTPGKGDYGLGLSPYHLTCGTFHGHEGGVNGTASIAIVTPDGDAGVVVALNLRSGGDPRLPAFADRILCGGTGH